MFNDESRKVEPYRVYGKAATSMDNKEFQRKMGRGNSIAGAKGERILFEQLRNKKNGWLPADMALFCSMKVPR